MRAALSTLTMSSMGNVETAVLRRGAIDVDQVGPPPHAPPGRASQHGSAGKRPGAYPRDPRELAPVPRGAARRPRAGGVGARARARAGPTAPPSRRALPRQPPEPLSQPV